MHRFSAPARADASAVATQILRSFRCTAAVPSLALISAVPTAVFAHASGNPPAKKPTVGTLGTAQMNGGDGRIGTTYTLMSGSLPMNCTLTRVEYSVSRFNVDKGSALAPKAGEKLIILHWLIQNPNPNDAYVNSQFLPFSTVAMDDQTRNHGGNLRLASAQEGLGTMLKPGQKFPGEVVEAGIVPAAGPIPKLIVNLGRKGTSEQVTRYMLGKAPNIVTPLAAGDADPSDHTGATALTEVPGKIGVVYPLGYYDWKINSIAFVPGPIGTESAGDGKRFLVVNVTLTNRTWNQLYIYTQYIAPATLITADDEKTTEYQFFKGKRDETYGGDMYQPGETVTFRMAFVVPNDTTGKKLTLAEGVDNSGGKTRALVFDLTGVK